MKLAVKLLEKENRFPKTVTGKEMGQILDFYNQTVRKEHEKDYENTVSRANKHYAKMFTYGLQHGFQEPYHSSTILVSKEDRKKLDKDN